MTAAELVLMAKSIAPVIKAHVEEKIATRTAELERRVAELEQRPSLKFCGIHNEQAPYALGDVVIRSGSLWTCVRPTRGAFDHAAFQLSVKKGTAHDGST